MNNTGIKQSQETLKQELDSLYLKLTDKINEYGHAVRNAPVANDQPIIEKINNLKKDQFLIKQSLVKIERTEQSNWGAFKTNVEQIVENAHAHLAA